MSNGMGNSSNNSGFNSKTLKWDEMDDAEKLLACQRIFGAVEALYNMKFINANIYMTTVYNHPKMDSVDRMTWDMQYHNQWPNVDRSDRDPDYDAEYEPMYGKDTRQAARDRARRNNGPGCSCSWRGWKSKDPKF